MLILKRRTADKCFEQSEIFVGDDLIITILSVDRGKILVGVQAPKSVEIYRGELLSEERKTTARRKAKGKPT